jgi:hypothetical protein
MTSATHGNGMPDPIRAQIVEETRNLFRWVAQQLPRFDPAPLTIDTLTLENVISFFAKAPTDPQIAAGALLRRPRPSGYYVLQLFLDESDEVCVDSYGQPYGRVVLARKLDAELAERFSEADLILFR